MSSSLQTNAIAAETTVGPVSLIVSDLDRSRRFYEAVLGLRARPLHDGALALTAGDGAALVTLHRGRAAAPRDPRATGLFHQAILVPSRLELAHALGRLARARWPLDGASDHQVSEALYLSDPDGNGIEIYRDRPRAQWPHGDRGELRMAPIALDLRGLAAELPAGAGVQTEASSRTRIGHVHLQVSDITEAEAFYHGVLGFDVTVSGYPGALFVSAGGYHHHIGLNTWHSAGSGPPASGSIGLRRFDVRVPDAAELERVLERVGGAGLAFEPGGRDGNEPNVDDGAAVVRDPSGNVVLLRHA